MKVLAGQVWHLNIPCEGIRSRRWHHSGSRTDNPDELNLPLFRFGCNTVSIVSQNRFRVFRGGIHAGRRLAGDPDRTGPNRFRVCREADAGPQELRRISAQRGCLPGRESSRSPEGSSALRNEEERPKGPSGMSPPFSGRSGMEGGILGCASGCVSLSERFSAVRGVDPQGSPARPPRRRDGRW